MAKSYCKLLVLIALLCAPFCKTDAASSQTIQIRTHFDAIATPATWLIIIRDADSSAVYPYLFDIEKPDNYYLIFTNARNYHVISIMQFDFYHRKLTNFCNFPQGIIFNKSFELTLSGALTPDLRTSSCALREYDKMLYLGQ